MHSNDALLELDGLTKRFGAVLAVDGVSERIPRGEYLCVLGPSGCGKTTLLRLIAGFETPDRGAIRLHGEDMAGIPPERRDVNVVFQSYALFPHLSVAKNIAFGLRMKKLGRADIEQRVDEAIRLVRLERESSRLPRELSGGQQQRVALARALVNRPSLLLLDEPLSALDASLRQHMQSELRRVQRETGVTFLHITHDQAEALSLADRLVVMQAGRIEQVGTPREVYERPVSRFVASFVGAANLLDGRVIDSDHVGLAAGSVVRVPTLPEKVLVGHALTLAVRPEAVTLGPPDAASGLCGRVVHAAFKGSDLEYSIELSSETVPSGTLVRARAPAGPGTTPVAEGESVSLRVREADWVVLPATDPGEPL